MGGGGGGLQQHISIFPEGVPVKDATFLHAVEQCVVGHSVCRVGGGSS